LMREAIYSMCFFVIILNNIIRIEFNKG